METLKRFADMLGALRIASNLNKHDDWSPERLAAHRVERVNRLVRFAAERSRFYARHYHGLDFSGDIPLGVLPIIDKKLLMENFDDVVTDDALKLAEVKAHMEALTGDQYYLGDYRVVATAGTSGLRGIFVYDRLAWRTILANTLRWNRFIGVHPRLPHRVKIVSIGADNPMHVTQRIPSSGDVGLFRILHIEATDPIGSIVAALNAFLPEVILSYPSVAALLAVEQAEGRLSIAPRVVSTHSEVLTNEMRHRIRTSWGIEAFNHYGLTEEPHVAADCDRHEGLHIFEDLCVIEIVDADNLPVPDGTPGSKYLLTNLYNFTQPLIRYEVTDVLTRSPVLCGCGRPFGLIGGIGGRSEDVLYLPSRSGGQPVPITPLSLEMCIEGFKEATEYAVTHSADRILVSIVPHSEMDQEAFRSALTGRLTRLIDKAGAVPPPIEVKLVGELERRREKMGKIKLVGAAPRQVPGSEGTR